MRHHGLRVVISSQSPKSIPAEILDLSTLCLIHRFIAHDWFTYLQQKVHMEPERYNQIMKLETGQALLFYSKWSCVIPGTLSYVVPVSIRARITMDGGRSK
jgi:DNA phosphorothioation-dependent restriction protein DptH